MKQHWPLFVDTWNLRRSCIHRLRPPRLAENSETLTVRVGDFSATWILPDVMNKLAVELVEEAPGNHCREKFT